MKLSALDYYERARNRSCEGDNKGAIADINRAIRSDPRMAIAYFARGDIKRAIGDAQGAVADFTIGIKLNPKFAPAYVGRGNARRNLDDTKGAVDDFNKAIKLDAKYAPAYVGRGMARAQRGIGSAINDFNKAAKLDPKSSEAYFGRGWVRAGNTKQKISDFTRAIKLNPQHDMAYMLRGEAYRANSKTDKAIADFTKAIEIGVPNWAHAYGNRGAEYLKKGDYSKALADFNKAIELEPKLAELRLGRGTAYLEIGNMEKARYDLTLSVRLDTSFKSLARPLLERCIMIRSENQFGRAISNTELVLSDVPPPNADWLQIAEFALTFDGYEHSGSSNKCAAIADARRHRTLSDLRTCLFFEQRRWHHFGNEPDDESMTYIRTVIEKIRHKVAGTRRSHVS